MDLVDSYVNTLRLFLPKAQREDVVRELTEEIRSEAADKEAELGRALNQGEQAAILSRYGHPMLTAARYRPQRYLIGPVVFPYYWLALKVLLGMVTAGHLIAMLVRLAPGAPDAALGSQLEGLIQNVLAVTAWTTMMAAVADYWLRRRRVLETWDPRSLAFPALPARHAERAVSKALYAAGATGRHPLLSRHFEEPTSMSGLVIYLVLSVYWLLALKFPFLIIGPAAEHLSWGPAMDRLYPVFVVMQVLMLLGRFTRSMRPPGAPGLRTLRFARILADVLFIYFVLTSNHDQWMTWAGAAGGRINPNSVVATAFFWAAIFAAIGMLRRIWCWFTEAGPGSASAATVAIVAICVGGMQ
jgi:hypothetical protein